MVLSSRVPVKFTGFRRHCQGVFRSETRTGTQKQKVLEMFLILCYDSVTRVFNKLTVTCGIGWNLDCNINRDPP